MFAAVGAFPDLSDDLATVARVVEPSHERPEVLEDMREQLAEVGQRDETQRDADQRVQDRRYPARRRHRGEVTVT